MKTFTSIICAVSLFGQVALADCDFKTGISPAQGGGYIYTRDCHLKVGTMVKDLATKDQQISNLNQAITLKDLAIKDADDRTQMWMKTSVDLEQKTLEIQKLQKTNDWLYFGLGALTVIGAGFAAAQLSRH